MPTAAELADQLTYVQERLDAIPLIHLQDSPARWACKRLALEAHRAQLEAELSTALVREQRQAVEDQRRAVENTDTTTRAPSEPEATVSTAAAS